MPDMQNDTNDIQIHEPEPLKRRTSRKAIVAFLLGVSGLVLWVITGIPAIIVASSARKEIRGNPSLRGAWLANLGLALGIAGMVLAPMVIVGGIVASLIRESLAGNTAHGERIAHFALQGMIGESPADDPRGMLTGQADTLKDVVERFRQAREDDDIKAVIVTADSLLLDLSSAEELRREIAACNASGKKVFAYCEDAMIARSAYLVLSAATEFHVVPTASIDLRGLYGEQVHLKDGLAKIGVEADVVQIGDYKSAGEMFSRAEPSEPAKEDMNRLFDGLYESCVNAIAESRHKTVEEARRLIDGGPYSADRAAAAGLIDSVVHRDAFLEGIKGSFGDRIRIDNRYRRAELPHIDPQRPIATCLNLAKYFIRVHNWSWKSQIGLIYVEGMIVPGSGGSGAAWSGDIRDALKTAAADDSIKAVVLRVNSPGGSATASEIIWRAAQALQKKKPLVVSMGSMAASGGYYVACGANAIFADETTLTGSIGVIAGKMVTAGLWNKLGVNWFAYQRGADADIYSGAHPFTEAQRAKIVEDMLAIYGTFKEHVAAGRGGKLAKGIDELAGGRVFTGKQALEAGLVDTLGGLKEAIAFAAGLVSLEDYNVEVVPEPKNAAELFVEAFFGGPRNRDELSFDTAARVPVLADFMGHGNGDLAGPVQWIAALDPCHAQATLDMLRRAQLLGREGVAMLMPQLVILQ